MACQKAAWTLYDLIGSYFIVLDKGKYSLFDGSCGLCQGSCKMVAYHERPSTAQAEKPVYFASLVSSGLPHLPANLPTQSFTWKEIGFYQSTAVFRLCTRLKWPWRFLYYFRFVPCSLRMLFTIKLRFGEKKRGRTPGETIKPEWRSRLLM